MAKRCCCAWAPVPQAAWGTRRRRSRRAGPQYVIVSARRPVKPGEGALRSTDVEVNVDPLAEWTQMYHEVWRIERSYFYDPNLHGVNIADSEKEYEKYLASLSSRADLNYMFHDMLSDMTSGHLRGNGGDDSRRARPCRAACWARITRSPTAAIASRRSTCRKAGTRRSQSPLAQPGLNVNEGDYLLAVNGQELDAHGRRLAAAGEHRRQAHDRSRSRRTPPAPDAREITVVPIASEQALRHSEWLDENRRKVDQLSGGKLAYVYMPDTGQGGYTSFNRYYFAQSDKQGAVIDERFNARRPGGGLHHRSPEPPLAGLVEPALRRNISHAGGLHPGAEGDDRQ